MKNRAITRRLTTTILANGIVIEIRITNGQLDVTRATSGRSIRSSLLTRPISNEFKPQSATTIRINKPLIERSHKPTLEPLRFAMVLHQTTPLPSVRNLNSHSWTKKWERFRRD